MTKKYDWDKIIPEFEKSGLSRAEFSRQNGIKTQSLGKQIKKRKENPPEDKTLYDELVEMEEELADEDNNNQELYDAVSDDKKGILKEDEPVEEVVEPVEEVVEPVEEVLIEHEPEFESVEVDVQDSVLIGKVPDELIRLSDRSTVWECLMSVVQTKGTNEKVKLFRRMISATSKQAMSIKTLIRYAYDDTIVTNLPRGIPKDFDFYPGVTDQAPVRLQMPRTANRLVMFVTVLTLDQLALPVKDPTGLNDVQAGLRMAKAERKYLELLRALSKEECDILNLAKDGKLNLMFHGLTKKFFTINFPGLIVK